MKLKFGQSVYVIIRNKNRPISVARAEALIFYWVFNETWSRHNRLAEYIPVRLEVWQSKLLEVLCES